MRISSCCMPCSVNRHLMLWPPYAAGPKTAARFMLRLMPSAGRMVMSGSLCIFLASSGDRVVEPSEYVKQFSSPSIHLHFPSIQSFLGIL